MALKFSHDHLLMKARPEKFLAKSVQPYLSRGVFHMSSGANLRRILHRLAATILEICK